MQSILLLVAPALFAASIYMVLGRIILLTEGEHHSMIRAKWLTKIFVTGDVVSFLMQGAGGGIMAGGSIDNYNTGENIIMGGLIVQIVVFGFFVVVASVFNFRMMKTPTSKVLSHSVPWQKHLTMLYVLSLLIMVRSIVRLIEYTQGNAGFIISHEWYLYVFDAALMSSAMAVFAWWHPSEVYAMLRRERGKGARKALAVRKAVVVYEMSRLEGRKGQGSAESGRSDYQMV
jgi:hypothetical protein